jgi:hypothetical protein
VNAILRRKHLVQVSDLDFDQDNPDGREAARRLYGGTSDSKGRGHYGCDLDEDGYRRRAGTEYCDWKCLHPSLHQRGQRAENGL